MILSNGKDLEDLKLLVLLILRRDDLQYIAVESDVSVLRVLKLIIPPLELGKCKEFLNELLVPIHQGQIFIGFQYAVSDVKDLGSLYEVQIENLVP